MFNQYNVNGKNANGQKGMRKRGQSVNHNVGSNINSKAASRQGKQSVSIDRTLELNHKQQSQAIKNLKNNMSQPMSNVAKIGQETKSLKTIQYNPIGLNMANNETIQL